MGKEFDRVAIVVEGSSVEYIILEPELIIDFGEGQGPKGGVITLKDGWIAALGSGEARLAAGYASQGGDIPPSLVLRDAQVEGLGLAGAGAEVDHAARVSRTR